MCPGTPTPRRKGAAAGKRVSPRETGLPRKEWHFAGLSDAEARACCLYEYAREFAKASSELRRRLKAYAACRKARQGSPASNRSFTAYLSLYEMLGTPEGSPYSRADMANVPWCDLREDERNHAVALITPSSGPSVLKPGDEIPGMEIPTYYNPPKRDGQGITLRILQDVDSWPAYKADFDDFIVHTIAVAKTCHQRTDALQVGFFAVDWNHTNEHLRNALLNWLDTEIAKRANRKPAYGKRGKGKGAITADSRLKALGAFRLLRSGFTSERALAFSEQQCGTPLYLHPAEWSRAKTKTFPQTMKHLFRADAVWVE